MQEIWDFVFVGIIAHLKRSELLHRWGVHAQALRKLTDRLNQKYAVPIRHVDHCNPAAMGDAFCNRNHFQEINNCLQELCLPLINWLPSKGWQEQCKCISIV